MDPRKYAKAIVALVGTAAVEAWAAEGATLRTAASALVVAFATYLVRNRPDPA